MKVLSSILFGILLFHGCSFQSQEPDLIRPEKSVTSFTGNVMISKDGGKTWLPVNTNLPADFVPFSAHADNNDLLLGSNYGELFSINTNELKSTKKESAMSAFPNIEPKQHHSVSGIFESHSGQYIYVNATGIFHKKQNAGFWQPIPLPDGINYVSQVKEDDKNNLYIATPFGVYHTSNNGKNWDRIFDLGFVHDLIVYDDRLVVNGIHGVYLSNDGGYTWKVNSDLNILTNDNKNGNSKMIQDGDNLMIIKKLADPVYLNGSKNVIFHSADRGETWKKHISNDFFKAEKEIFSMLVDQQHIISSIKQGLISSEDNGKTWSKVLRFQEEKDNYSYQIIKTGDTIYCIKMFFGC